MIEIYIYFNIYYFTDKFIHDMLIWIYYIISFKVFWILKHMLILNIFVIIHLQKRTALVYNLVPTQLCDRSEEGISDFSLNKKCRYNWSTFVLCRSTKFDHWTLCNTKWADKKIYFSVKLKHFHPFFTID